MKILSNRTILTLIISPVLATIVVSPVLAVESNNNSDITPAACLHITTLRSNGRDALAKNLSKMNQQFSDRMKKLASDKTSIDKKHVDNRAAAKTQFEAKVAKLLAKSGWTDAQKQAIQTFKTNVELAKTTRDTAVDAAKSQYRSDLTQLLTKQQTDLSNATVAYQQAFEKAFQTASDNCTKKADLAATKTAVKTAHDTLKSSIKTEKNKDAIKLLAKTRDNAIKLADETFKTQLAGFAQTLKQALNLND